jgi:hypothetical protein
MKTIQVSNPLYGAIWSRSVEGDKSEEDILRRLLGLPSMISPSAAPLAAAPQPPPPPPPSSTPAESSKGFVDRRNNLLFPNGFRIFRNFKGQDHEARVVNGKWQLDGGDSYDSINALSRAIGAETESAWHGWRYKKQDGTEPLINDLRKPELIRRRA